MAKKNQRIRAT